jgi:hypothetical protein
VLFFQHAGKKLGKVLTVRGNAAQPITVKLESCGTVIGRVVDERGNPVPGIHLCLSEEAGPGYEITQADKLGRFQMTLFPGQKYCWGLPFSSLQPPLDTVQVESRRSKDLGELVLTSKKGR